MRRLRDKPKVCDIHYYTGYQQDPDAIRDRAWWACGRYVEDVTLHSHSKDEDCPGTCRILSPLVNLPGNFGRTK